ncbi:cell division protein FtsZ [Oceanotoga sp. DSM 15011]|nr:MULTISPECIES: cell division protein FtsZ [Oceanotoga]MDO7977150.1 cell division protein FtsZ [Oceanotoga teriensis]UYP00247.1 cell division protein FtsZ [Oceanotoga sp. DSM 15011]
MPFEIDDNDKTKNIFSKKSHYTIKVIGVGGAGNNAIQRMVTKGVEDVELIAANTDVQVLESNPTESKIQLGKELTRGLGAGGDPSVGRDSAIESTDEIKEILKGTDLLFITAGLGGGTGTGAAPVISDIATNMGILTVAIVTMPFHFEGSTKERLALNGLQNLKHSVDSLIKISNDKLIDNGENIPIDKAFEKADDILYQAITGISDLITKPGMINLDFADVASVLKIKGSAMLGIGLAKGERRAEDAIKNALNSKLLEDQVRNANAALVNIAGKNPTTEDVRIINEILRSYAIDDAKLKMGISIVEMPPEVIKVTVVASGYDKLPGEDNYLDLYEQPALYRQFGKTIVTDEMSKLEKFLNENVMGE